ncbi:hypothetical protein LCGC14_1162270 [marine sediment metagenome]|uniref:Portal protein n=1 Tax=marine sediment metagenome TaxID=412755 RepID=A0A0F9LXB3_9ZZZZ
MRPNTAADHLKVKKSKDGEGKDALWTYAKNRYDLGMDVRRPFEQQWIVNIAFLIGKQYTVFNQVTALLQQLTRKKGRIWNVDNQLLPKWRRQISDLIKNNPIMSVVPETNEDEDIKAAKLGDKVMKGFWRQNKMKTKIRQLAGWIFACGNGFLDDRWNPKIGPIEVDPKSGKPYYLGDVDCGVWSPLEVLVPFTAMGDTDLHSFPWMIKAKWRSLDWIRGNYKRGKEVMDEGHGTPPLDIGFLMGGARGSAREKVEGAIVMNLYVQPNHDKKRGLFLTAANKIVLEKDEYPYDFYNLEQFKDIDVPGIFWGKATLEEGVGLQKTWNRTVSGIDEFNRTMAKGKGLLPRGANLDALPDDQHGEWLEYTPVMGYKPEILSLKGLPSTYPLILEVTKTSLEDLFSQHEVSRGTNKSDIRSGEMVSILREQDAHGNIPAHAVFEESLEAVMSRVLKRIQAGYGTQRMIKVVGREGEYDVFAFRGADLRNNTDVSVKRQSSLPDSRIAREAKIMERFQGTLYGDPADPEVKRHVMNMLDDAVVKDIYSDTRLDEAYARWENQMMMQEEVKYLVNDYDDHQIHVRELDHHRKSMDYQRAKVEDPAKFLELELRFAEHRAAHQEFIAQMRARMLAEQEQMEKGGKK